jgi:hypothetical protein
MPQCQFLVFCCFRISKKLHRKYSRNWTKQKLKFPFFPTRDGIQSKDGGEPGPATPWGGAAYSWPVPPGGVATWHTSWHRPSAYINFLDEKTLKPRSILSTLSSWFIDLSSLCCLWSCMLSVASRYLGRVDASDSKREYLCSIVGSCLW